MMMKVRPIHVVYFVLAVCSIVAIVVAAITAKVRSFSANGSTVIACPRCDSNTKMPKRLSLQCDSFANLHQSYKSP